MAYRWLQELLDLLLPELEDLPAGPAGEAKATAWFERLLVRFAERGLSTPAQQKNRVVDARNAIRARFGDDHPSLAYVGFDERTWQSINLPTHDRTEARNEHQRLLRHPEKIVAKAAKLLESAKFEDLAVGLGLCTGRRMSELLDGHARFAAATGWSVLFTGQRKHKGDRETFSFEIPTLAPAQKVLGAWGRLAVMLGDEVLDPQSINNRYGHGVNQAADRHFRGLIPPRLPRGKQGKEGEEEDPHAQERKGDALYLHLFRAVYATIAVHWFCPPRVNRLVFKAEIQGHRRVLEAPTRAMRRSYTAARHYDDYQVADSTGKNLDGRQGIKLGKVEGLEVLHAFQEKEDGQEEALAGQEPSPRRPNTPLAPGLNPPRPPPPPRLRPPPPPPPHPDTSMLTPSPVLPPAGPRPKKARPRPSPRAKAAPKPPREKKPRPVTYRIYPADRRRLAAFRTAPTQSQADNFRGVVDLLENAAAALLAQGQTQAQHQEALAKAEQSAQERDQARREAQEQAERLREQEKERQRLQGALAEASAAAAKQNEMAAGGGATVALAVVARELLGLATGAECPPPLQARLISLATQALGGVAPATPTSSSRQEKRQDGASGTRRAGRSTRSGEERFFGPLFASKGGEQKKGPEILSNEADAHDAKGQEPTGEAAGATAPEPADKTVGATAHLNVTENDQGRQVPAPGTPTATPPEPANKATQGDAHLKVTESFSARGHQEPAKEQPVNKGPVAPRAFTRRGGAAEKLENALQAVVAHNEGQTSREKKWAVTESSLARLTGCFRPAVRAFFAERAKEVEEHNQRHHLTPGHNAARGKKGETIEGEVGWRGTDATS